MTIPDANHNWSVVSEFLERPALVRPLPEVSMLSGAGSGGSSSPDSIRAPAFFSWIA